MKEFTYVENNGRWPNFAVDFNGLSWSSTIANFSSSRMIYSERRTPAHAHGGESLPLTMYKNGKQTWKSLNRQNGLRTTLEPLSCHRDFKITQAQTKVSFFLFKILYYKFEFRAIFCFPHFGPWKCQNPLGLPAPPTLGLNIDRCIIVLKSIKMK